MQGCGVLHLLYAGPAGKPFLRGKKESDIKKKSGVLAEETSPLDTLQQRGSRPPSIVRERSAPD